ncbi:MAG: hypothetical protein U0U70_02010 [Chitinophagaceae bacterium]
MKQMTGFLFAAFFFIACNKKSDPPQNDVWIRLQNESGIVLEDASVGNTPYGLVTTGQVTGYKKMDLPVYSGYCGFKTGGQFMGAGVLVCGTPPPAAFDPGYYTFKVLPAVNGYYDLVVEKR